MIRIVICDDNEHVAEGLKTIIEKSDYLKNNFYTIDIINNKEDLLYEIGEENNIDILFMDIILGEDNGIDIVKELKEDYPYINVIYITAHLEYVFDVFETGPVGFVRKPFNPIEVNKFLKIAINKIDNSDFFTIKKDGGITKLQMRDVMHIHSDARQVVFVDKNGDEHKVYGKLDKYEEELSEYKQFMRIHKSHIINVDYIKKYEKTKITLINDEEISVSRDRRSSVQEGIMTFVNI